MHADLQKLANTMSSDEVLALLKDIASLQNGKTSRDTRIKGLIRETERLKKVITKRNSQLDALTLLLSTQESHPCKQ